MHLQPLTLSPPSALRWRWAFTAVLWLLVWLGGYGLLRLQWSNAGRWALLAAPLLLYGLWALWRGLPLNHREGETAVLPTLGFGNALTLYRGLALALISGFLFLPWPTGWMAWLPMLLYTSAIIADYLDGYVARATNHATTLGAQLDMEFDGLGMLLITLLAVSYGQLPLWYLPLGLARYIFLLGLWWRRQRSRPLHDMTDSVHRRIFAGFQMGFMSAVLWPIVPPVGATIAGTLFATATAVSFLRDWLVVTGRLDPTSTSYKVGQRRVVWLTRQALPLILRGVFVGTAVLLVRTLALPPVPWQALLTTWGLPLPGVLAAATLILFAVGTFAIALGILGRLFSLLLIFPIAFDFISQGATALNSIILTCLITLMLLGTGPFSLWRPEEYFLTRRFGGRSGGRSSE